MKFNPRFTTFRMRIILLAIIFAIVGAAMLLAGHDACHRGRDRLAIAGILFLSAAIPESPGKIAPEKYPLVGGKP